MISLDTFPADHYGHRTPKMKQIIERFSVRRWFQPSTGDSVESAVRERVNDHLAQLSSTTRVFAPKRTDLLILEGGFDVLHEQRWGVDPYEPWGNRWAAWRLALAHLARTMQQAAVETASIKSLLRSPLWPVSGQPAILGGTICAREEILEEELCCARGSRDWVVAWGLLCQAEFDVWQSLLGELLHGQMASNPFEPLLDIYAQGHFPMGWIQDSFVLYRYRPKGNR